MILGTAWAIKILIPLAVSAAGWLVFRRKLSAGRLAVLLALAVVFAFVANGASGLVPPVCDEVTLTAMGEKSDEAQAMEVFLAGYTVDGTEHLAGKDLDIRAGKWFWKGETYCWRPEADPRQPEGVTRTITVGIPVGWDRTLDFEGSFWGGKVQVTAGGKTWVADTYVDSESITAVAVTVGRSGSSALIWDQVRQLAAYAVVFLGLAALALTALVWKRESVARFNARHKGVLLFAAIALCQFAFALKYAGTDGFWVDELYEIGWSEEFPNLLQRAFTDGVPRPLAAFILGVWIKIAPYGEKWLLLLPEVFTAVGIFLVGLCGKEYKNVRTGVFAALFTAASGTMLWQSSYEFRCYSMYFCFAALLLYLYFRCYNNKMSDRLTGREQAVIVLVMVVFSQMHAYAYVICAALFVFDLFSHWSKVKKFSLTRYVAVGLCAVPTAIAVLSNRFIETWNAAWQPVPNITEINGLIDFFTVNVLSLRTLFLLGVAMLIGVAAGMRPKEDDRADMAERLKMLLPLYITVAVIAVMYIYGHINTRGTLWYSRYFLGVFPGCFVICGFAADKVCEWAVRWSGRTRPAGVVATAFVCLAVLLTAIPGLEDAAVMIRSQWREAADYIYNDVNYIFDDSTLILETTSRTAKNGWNKYYVTRYGRRDPLNVYDPKDLTEDELLQYNRIYMVYPHELPKEELTQLLDTYYMQVSNNNDVKVAVYERNPDVPQA